MPKRFYRLLLPPSWAMLSTMTAHCRYQNSYQPNQMGLSEVLSKADAEIRFHGIGLHAHVDVTILISCEHVVAELHSDWRVICTVEAIVVFHFLIGIVEEAKSSE